MITNEQVREPVAAGRYYPANPTKLQIEIQQLLQNTAVSIHNDTRAIIIPHAGYIFSGSTVAIALKSIPPDKEYQNIFIIGTAHHDHFDGASVYNQGNYHIPLGNIKVNKDIARALNNKNKRFLFNHNAHQKEHSIEVELPFLQQHFIYPIQIVPILIGTQDIPILENIAETLKEYFTPDNLFIISSDFSHFTDYSTANMVDKVTANSISANSANHFRDTMQTHERNNYKNLSTAACGFSSIYTLLKITENKQDIDVNLLHYQNSGDCRHGNQDRVVGYWAISFTGQNNSFSLNKQEKNQLLEIARSHIAKQFTIPTKIYDTRSFSEKLSKTLGVFCTLTIHGKIRGSTGRFDTSDPLYKTVGEMAVKAAFHDQRFEPLRAEEYNAIRIALSILTPRKKISNIDEIEQGRHGIYIQSGVHSGSLLPEIATSAGWTIEAFLGHCAEKAGIGWEGWQKADIYTFETYSFSEK